MNDPLKKLRIVAVTIALLLSVSGCAGNAVSQDGGGKSDSGDIASQDAGDMVSQDIWDMADYGVDGEITVPDTDGGDNLNPDMSLIQGNEEAEMQEAEIQGYPYGAGMFCWDHLVDENEAMCLVDNEITEIYQYIKPEYSDEEVCDFIARMSDHEIASYILTGEPEWCIDAKLEDIKTAVGCVTYYNDLAGERGHLSGIVLDVEPYVLKGWENNAASLMDQYVANVAAIREYVNEEGLEIELCLCVPYSFDLMGYEEQLKELIRNADKVLVLNYNKRTEVENIRNEVAFAGEFGRKIVNVYELQSAPQCPEPERMSYCDEGLPAARAAYGRLLAAYPDSELGIAYHTLNDFIDLVNKENH